MLELHYFMLAVVVLLAMAYYYNEIELGKAVESIEGFDTKRGELKSVIVGKDAIAREKGACRPFNYERLVLLDDPNLPLDKKTVFQTEAEDEGHPVNRVGRLDDDLVSDEGKVCFGKTKLLFDGIWERKCEQEGLDRDCKWKLVGGNGESKWTGGWDRHTVPKRCGRVLEGKYCADKFFHFPEKCMPVGRDIYIGDQCGGVMEGKGKDDVCCYEGNENCDDTVIQA